MRDQAQVTASAQEPDADDHRRAQDLRNKLDWYQNGTTSKSPSTTNAIELIPILKSSGVSTEGSTADNAEAQAQDSTNQGIQRSTQAPAIAPPREQAEPSFDERRKVNRVLEWYHIFFISLSGTLGIGLYVQGGSILRLGGPYVLLFSFVGLSVLAWAVMQGVAEMLCLWPISGALTEFVKAFVDDDLGTAVGIAYWFSYSSGFAAIIMTLADEVAFWSADHYLRGFLLLSGIPIILFFINTLGVEVYAWIELLGGGTKLLFIFVIITSTLGTIIERSKDGESIGSRWHGSHFDASATKSQAFAFLMSFRMAAFAFVGIEITAATALEAKASTRQVAPGAREEAQAIAPRHVPITRLKRPATKVPIVVGFVYILAAIMVALSVDATDPCLPAQTWTIPGAASAAICAEPKSDSAFVFAAQSVKWPDFSNVVTAFIVFTAFSAANTQLYVGSRTLFGLARTSRSGWGIFGRTTRTRRVPLSALLATSVLVAFPFLSYLTDKPKAIIFDVLYTSSSLTCVIVWACECWAFIRFFYCMKRHRDRLNGERDFYPPLNRFLRGTINYPWISHGQSSHPCMTIIALVGCVFVLIPANFACLFSGFDWKPFLSSFTAEILFILVFIYLKYRRDIPLRDWAWLVSLSNYERDVKPILTRLQAIRENSIPAKGEEGVPALVDPNANTLSWWGRKRADWF